jgi:hypothetical protein
MDDTSSPKPPRPTLKLKAGARKSADSGKTPIIPQPDKKARPKPGADWSEEYKRRMQEDMDALLR